MELVKNSLEFSLRKRKWVVLLGVCGFSSYGVYKIYHLPSVSRKRKRFVKLLGALVSMVEMMSDFADTLGVVFKELKEFLESDSDQIPNTLRQLSKIAASDEFSLSLTRVSEALTTGLIQGHYSSFEMGKVESNQIMDKLMSRAGTGFVSVVVGSFARNLVLGFYSNIGNDTCGLKFVAARATARAKTSGLPEWLCSEKSKLVMGDCIKTFVSTAVAVYLDKTTNINFYDDMFSGLTDPKHQKQVRDILISICNGAVETFIKTSHQVLTSSSSKSTEDDSKDAIFRQEKPFQKSGWVNSVSSTLSVPSNRRFVVDVTGTVTFETIRSVINFFLWKVSDAVRTSLNDEVLGKGLEVVNYVGAKSCVILTICLALYLHIIYCRKAFLPAA